MLHIDLLIAPPQSFTLSGPQRFLCFFRETIDIHFLSSSLMINCIHSSTPGRRGISEKGTVDVAGKSGAALLSAPDGAADVKWLYTT